MPVDDAYQGLLWVFENIEKLGGDKSKVITVGNSAGANLATVVTRRLRDSKLPYKVAAQILRIPMVCHPQEFPPKLASQDSSYNFYTDSKTAILSKTTVDDFWSFYGPGDEDKKSLDCSPLLATEFKGFPPTYVNVCGCDPLRDEGWEFARRMDAAGVKIKFDVIPGLPHGFWQWPQLKATTKATEQFVDALKWGIAQA